MKCKSFIIDFLIVICLSFVLYYCFNLIINKLELNSNISNDQLDDIGYDFI